MKCPARLTLSASAAFHKPWRLKDGLKHARAAEAPEALPDAILVAELGRQRPPDDAVMRREVVQRREKAAVVAVDHGHDQVWWLLLPNTAAKGARRFGSALVVFAIECRNTL